MKVIPEKRSRTEGKSRKLGDIELRGPSKEKTIQERIE